MLREVERYLLKRILYLDLKVYTVICVQKFVSNILLAIYLEVYIKDYTYIGILLYYQCEDFRFSPTCAHLKYMFFVRFNHKINTQKSICN